MSGHLRKGRITGASDTRLDALNISLDVDKRLALADIEGSQAHATMLAAQKLICEEDAKKMLTGLQTIEKELRNGTFPFRPEHEDIHMNIEVRLGELIGGDIAGKLHTGRSRNDQVALDLRLFLRRATEETEAKLTALMAAFAEKALEGAEMLMPGYTHLQPAQGVSFGHHCLAYAAMFERDLARFADVKKRINAHCPLGAGALAGSGLPLDPEQTAKALGFAAPVENSLDAVSDRDFIVEWLAAAALTATHLSRLGEELVLWVSPGFAFVHLPEGLATTSSMLPQKRNPDGAELLRATPGKMAGSLMDALMMLKGLPLAYAKDLQQDKQALFGALDLLLPALDLAIAHIEGLVPDEAAMAKAAEQGYPQAVDLANWLVQEHGVSFREAHERVGRLVSHAEAQTLTLPEMQSQEVLAQLNLPLDTKLPALEAKTLLQTRSLGGGKPAETRSKAKAVLARLKKAGFMTVLACIVLLGGCGKQGGLDVSSPSASYDAWEVEQVPGPEDRLPPPRSASSNNAPR